MEKLDRLREIIYGIDTKTSIDSLIDDKPSQEAFNLFTALVSSDIKLLNLDFKDSMFLKQYNSYLETKKIKDDIVERINHIPKQQLDKLVTDIVINCTNVFKHYILILVPDDFGFELMGSSISLVQHAGIDISIPIDMAISLIANEIDDMNEGEGKTQTIYMLSTFIETKDVLINNLINNNKKDTDEDIKK